MCTPRNRHTDSEKASAGKLSVQAIARDCLAAESRRRASRPRTAQVRGGRRGGGAGERTDGRGGSCAIPTAPPICTRTYRRRRLARPRLLIMGGPRHGGARPRRSVTATAARRHATGIPYFAGPRGGPCFETDRAGIEMVE